VGGGIAGAAPTGGASLLLSAVGVSGVTAGWVAVAHGATGVVAGIATIADSMSLSTGGGGGKTSRKANLDRVAAAKTRLQGLEEQYNALEAKRLKTPEDKELLSKLERAIRKARDDMKKSENHAQKGQGYR
jgi:hypothetical protein